MKKILIYGLILIILSGFISCGMSGENGTKKKNAMKKPPIKESIKFNFQNKLMTKQDSANETKINVNKSVKNPTLKAKKRVIITSSNVVKNNDVNSEKKNIIATPKHSKNSIVGKTTRTEVEYSLQFASFRNMQDAISLKEKLSARFQHVKISKIDIPQKGEFYRVMMEPVSGNRIDSFKKILKEEFNITPWIKTLK